jgi:hypothetical protein
MSFSWWVSLFGLFAVTVSYFLKKRWQFLIAQGSSILLFAVSNFSLGLYYAAIASGVSLVRVITYFILEKKDKNPTFALKTFFAGLVVLSYLVTNVVILNDYNPWDILLMGVNVSFVYIIGIRNMRTMRYCLLPPIALAFTYGRIVGVTPFNSVSQALEFFANLVAIIIYERANKKNK